MVQGFLTSRKAVNDMARCENCIHDKVCDMWAVVSGIPFVNADTCEHFSPTADVVPKSEVELLEIELERARRKYLPSGLQACSEEEAIKIGREYGKADVAREIFEEIERTFTVKYSMCTNPVLVLDSLSFAELKKKYQEGEPNGN